MNTKTCSKKRKHTYATLFLFISLYVFFFLPLTPILAQNTTKTDQHPPTIKHKPFRSALNLGDQVIFRTSIDDNQALGEVHLFYRTIGKKEYTSLKMESVGSKEYLTIIPQRFIFLPGIEYYIQASDTAGNTATQGAPNTPLLIRLKAPPEARIGTNRKVNPSILSTKKSSFRLSTQSSTTNEKYDKKKPWYKRWWVWSIAIGVVAGVAAASGGGSGGNSPSSPTTGTGTVTAGVP